jgi:hypothetical protein
MLDFLKQEWMDWPFGGLAHICLITRSVEIGGEKDDQNIFTSTKKYSKKMMVWPHVYAFLKDWSLDICDEDFLLRSDYSVLIKKEC